MPDLKTLCRDFGVTMTSKEIPDPPLWHGDEPYSGQGWECTLRMDGRSMTVPFWVGAAHVDRNMRPKKPRPNDLLECLLSDASSADESFEYWCSVYGYDTDSRRAYGEWNAVRAQTAQLKLLLGSHYIRFTEHEE